jgi:hypothetical protein
MKKLSVILLSLAPIFALAGNPGGGGISQADLDAAIAKEDIKVTANTIASAAAQSVANTADSTATTNAANIAINDTEISTNNTTATAAQTTATTAQTAATAASASATTNAGNITTNTSNISTNNTTATAAQTAATAASASATTNASNISTNITNITANTTNFAANGPLTAADWTQLAKDFNSGVDVISSGKVIDCSTAGSLGDHSASAVKLCAKFQANCAPAMPSDTNNMFSSSISDHILIRKVTVPKTKTIVDINNNAAASNITCLISTPRCTPPAAYNAVDVFDKQYVPVSGGATMAVNIRENGDDANASDYSFYVICEMVHPNAGVAFTAAQLPFTFP